MSNHAARPEKPYPRIASHINFHARHRPEKIAVLRSGAAISYATLSRDLAAMVHRIGGLNLPPGAVAAIGHNDLYIQLLLAFGFETLGIATGSFRPVEGAECHGLLAHADLVLTQNPDVKPHCRRMVHITDGWLESILQNPAPAAAPSCGRALGRDPLVVLRSSGTTGTPKRMLLDYRMMNERLARQRDPLHGFGINARSRFFAAMHLGVGSIYMAAANCFRLGATFMFAPGLQGLDRLAAYRPTHMTILPFHLRRLLEQMPATGAPGPLLPGLILQTIGARLPADLRRLALQKLCGAIMENYGTNEAGPIGMVDHAGIVSLTPGVTAEITGADGGTLPPGETGLLRVRGAGMAAAYLDDSAATAAMFRDGWFTPGDLAATAAAPRQLRLVGRRSDVLNLGGLKTAAADLESKIQALPGVNDIALLQPGPAIEPTRVTVCVVTNPKFQLAAFIGNLKSIIDYPFEVQTVPAIPRNTGGKILRAQLQETLVPA